jgi:hypothetical protein
MSESFNPDRRQFLKVGLLGTAVMAAVSGGVALTRDSALSPGCLWLQRDDWLVFQAIVPVMLEGALPGEEGPRVGATNKIISGVDFTIAHFSPSVREEIRQLLWLLESSFTRPLLTGIWSSWTNAEAAEVQDFLLSWKESRFDLLRVGYSALHDLIAGAWYANPESWRRIHYPGPPVLR